MDWQPGPEDGDGGEGAGPDRDPGPPPAAGGQVPGPGPGPVPGPVPDSAPNQEPDPGPPPSAAAGRVSDPGSGPGPVPSGPDPRLAGFAWEESRDAAASPSPAPSGRLALLADELSGPERRCPGASDDELVGLLRAWAAIESWAAGARLGVVREMMRRDGPPSPGSDHGDLPETWSRSLRYELSAALACSTQSAETTAWLAWEQGARLPGTAARLEDGTLTPAKARAVTETFGQLMDADAAAAEAMIAGQLAGKTYTQVQRLAEQAALTVDPHLAERRREHAQKNNARVSFFREQAGTAALSGRDLPPDEALAAMANVSARAEEYRESGEFGGAPMGVLRAQAYLDRINGVPAAARIAAAEARARAADARDWARAGAAAREGNPDPGAGDATGPGAASPGAADVTDAREQGGPCNCPCAECDGSCLTGDDLDGSDHSDHSDQDDAPDGDEPDGDAPDGDEPDGASAPDSSGRSDEDDDPGDDSDPDEGGSGPGSGGLGPRPGAPAAGRARQPRPADLIVPLVTLLGLGQRPGEIHGFGLLDPALARQLAAAAAAGPGTEVCVTVTGAEGYAIGHGCARPARTSPRTSPRAGPPASLGAPRARLNLTIPAAALPGLAGNAGVADNAGPGSHADPARHAGPGSGHDPAGPAGSWAFTPRAPRGSPETSGGYGTWTLALPGGRELAVRLDPVPTLDCDHRYETRGYQPSDRLRHLVQIRDGTCTFPPCNRHARESDFEHALPYDQGGKTCACNAGARSRACHQVKQSPGWSVSQPRPGWHQWRTPAGRVYTQEPKRYPT